MFIPPYPPRPAAALRAIPLLRQARRNLIAVWPEEAFSLYVYAHRVFRRTLVIVNGPDAVKQAFVDGAAEVEGKSVQQRTALEPLIGDGLFVSDGDIWRQRRKVVAPVTHVSRLPELTPVISAGAWNQVLRWRALSGGSEVDALAGMAHLTAGIICATIFGRGITPASAQTIVSAFGSYQALIGQLDVLSLLGMPDLLPRIQGFRIRAAAKRIHRVLDSLVAAALDGEGEPSLLRSMSEAKLTGQSTAMDAVAFRNEAAVLFMAGHETTANAMAWAWYLLSQDAETEARLHREVDGVLDRDGAARFEHLERLPFARAVIEETLRLYPPIPLQARRVSGPLTIGPKRVDKGDIVILNAWTLHRHKRLWKDPDAFVPDRFMPGGSGVPSRYAYVPFSIGPRVCTGAAFGLTEAVLCLATLARHFRLRLKPGHVVEPVCRLSLRPGQSLPMLVEPRH